MNHLGIYFACVLVVLLGCSTTLVLVARLRKWRPKPIKLAWAGLVILGAVFIAGSVCAIAGRDIHILYWWLVGVSATIVFLALLCAAMNVLAGWLARKR